MRGYSAVFSVVFLLGIGASLFPQTHVSVPVDHAVYYLLDQAEARGLCSPLPAVRPYTRGRIIEAVNEILAAEPGRFGALSATEKTILQNTKDEFSKGEPGLDLQNGKYRFDTQGKSGLPLSGDLGLAFESLNSAAYYSEDGKTYFGTDTWLTLFTRGDIGNNFSYGIDLSGGLMKAQRNRLGTFDTFAVQLDPEDAPEFVNIGMVSNSQPLAFFPYTYQKKWDGFMFGSGPVTASSMKFWPQGFSVAPSLLSELTGSVFGDTLLLRFGRIKREWGAMLPGNSLVYSASARPFTGLEALFNPVSWFSFSSITGILEFYNGVEFADDTKRGGIYKPAMTFQNAFSLYQVDFNYGNYLHIDFGSAAIWAKRFELGYIFPLMDNFLFQNLNGKTDNVAIFGNLKLRYPGLGAFWFSVFVDEVEVSSVSQIFELDRHMFAYQAGLQGIIPGLPFASASISYTKVEPYNYTHHRNFVPFYADYEGPMEKAYTNNGVSLGHYIPPNSDEIKFRFDARPLPKTHGHFQYQLIRHGADFGPHQADGSSLYSEICERGTLRKNFLNDGAYEWSHIIKIGGEHKFDFFPLTVFAETGMVYSYFTDISDEEYSVYTPLPRVDGGNRYAEGEYAKSTAFIFTLGFRVFL